MPPAPFAPAVPYPYANSSDTTPIPHQVTMLLLPSRPATRAYVRAIVQKSSSSVGLTVDDHADVAASAASKSAAAASSDHAAASNASFSAQSKVLLEGTARVRSGLVWFKPTHVQLLAAPASDGTSCPPAWSALVVDGVAMPYKELAGVRMDESMLEFVVAHKPRTATAQDDPPPHHLRMYTRFEFNLWREALGSVIANTNLHAQSCASTSAGSKPSAVHAAQKWLALAEGGAASCS